MKQLLEFLPLVIFFAVFKLVDIYAATIALMASITVQVIVLRLIEKKWNKKHLGILAIALIFGGLTLAFRDPAFVKWKASIVTWAFAIGFFVSDKVFNKHPLKAAFEDNVTAPQAVWNQVTMIFVLSFVLQGALNLVVAYNFSEEAWVNFKVFGLMAMTFITAIVAVGRLYPYFEEQEESGDSE